MKKVILTLLSVVFAATIANAQEKDSTHKKWTVYTASIQGNNTCYIASFPESKTGNYRKRDEPYFLVTKINNGVFEVSTSSGYGYKKNSDVKVDIDGKKHNMFTKANLLGQLIALRTKKWLQI